MSDLSSKQDCTCRTVCNRRGNPFPDEWSWRCKLLPFEQPHPLARAAPEPCALPGELAQDIERKLFAAIREADAAFEKAGATGTKSWVRDFLLSRLEAHGLGIGMKDHVRASQPPTVVQDMEKIAWCQKVHEDLASYIDDGGGLMIHVRAKRALGIMFEEMQKLEKALYPSLTKSVLDACEICEGSRGGVPGNENIVESCGEKVTMCDYCSADEMRMPGFWKEGPATETLSQRMVAAGFESLRPPSIPDDTSDETSLAQHKFQEWDNGKCRCGAPLESAIHLDDGEGLEF